MCGAKAEEGNSSGTKNIGALVNSVCKCSRKSSSRSTHQKRTRVRHTRGTNREETKKRTSGQGLQRGEPAALPKGGSLQHKGYQETAIRSVWKWGDKQAATRAEGGSKKEFKVRRGPYASPKDNESTKGEQGLNEMGTAWEDGV